MTHGGKETVEVDGDTYTVERMNIWDRPMVDRILDDEDDESVQEDDNQGPLSALWRAGKNYLWHSGGQDDD